MDRVRAYRNWRRRRLAFIVPPLVSALGVSLWLAWGATAPPSVRIPCLTGAVLLASLVAFLGFQTLVAGRRPSAARLQHGRALRRQSRAHPALAFHSMLLMAGLIAIPLLLREAHPIRPTAVLPRRSAPPKAEPSPAELLAAVFPEPDYRGDPIPEPPRTPPVAPPPMVPALPGPIARAEPPAGRPTMPPPAPQTRPAAPPSVPEIVPILPLEPTHLQFEEQDLARIPAAAVASVPVQEEPRDLPDPAQENPFALRPGWEDFSRWRPTEVRLFGLLSRPLPDESDPDSLPPPEIRVDGLLLIGKDARVPGIEVAIEIPVSRHDLIEAHWLGAILPPPPGSDQRNAPNWDHFTAVYTRRVAGWASHSTFDLSASVGMSADHLREVAGVPDPQGVKLAPYVGIDIGFWKETAVGLLLHVGESIPLTTFGSSLGVTDISAMLRVDISERISLHGGYRILLLKYKTDEVSGESGMSLLHHTLTGPMMGLDVRF